MRTPDGLPDYDPALKAAHAAFEPELEAAIRRYEFGEESRVLDCPCGDGFYAKLFARHMRCGTLVAADHSPAYLKQAKQIVNAPTELSTQFVKADAYSLPLGASTFDLVWCAQSMISLKDPVAAIREMARVLKTGGRLAVLETDAFHYVLLPWPVGLELAIQKAIREACEKRYGSGAKFAQTRKLRGQFREVGLKPSGKATIVADRVAPFGPAEREFLLRHFEHLRTFIKPELNDRELEAFDRFASEGEPESFLNDLDGEFTRLVTVYHATK